LGYAKQAQGGAKVLHLRQTADGGAIFKAVLFSQVIVGTRTDPESETHAH